jgi:hypothetical protein
VVIGVIMRKFNRSNKIERSIETYFSDWGIDGSDTAENNMREHFRLHSDIAENLADYGGQARALRDTVLKKKIKKKHLHWGDSSVFRFNYCGKYIDMALSYSGAVRNYKIISYGYRLKPRGIVHRFMLVNADLSTEGKYISIDDFDKRQMITISDRLTRICEMSLKITPMYHGYIGNQKVGLNYFGNTILDTATARYLREDMLIRKSISLDYIRLIKLLNKAVKENLYVLHFGV